MEQRIEGDSKKDGSEMISVYLVIRFRITGPEIMKFYDKDEALNSMLSGDVLLEGVEK
jgi:hypothetical protein